MRIFLLFVIFLSSCAYNLDSRKQEVFTIARDKKYSINVIMGPNKSSLTANILDVAKKHDCLDSDLKSFELYNCLFAEELILKNIELTTDTKASKLIVNLPVKKGSALENIWSISNMITLTVIPHWSSQKFELYIADGEMKKKISVRQMNTYSFIALIFAMPFIKDSTETIRSIMKGFAKDLNSK